MQDHDETFMRAALQQAFISKANGDVPFGAAIFKDGKLIAAAQNSEMRLHDVTKHAETNAIAKASAILGRDLSGCTIYSTVEPCTMCSGAMLYACLDRIVIGASREDLPHLFRVRKIRFQNLADDYGHAPEVITGVLKNACIAAFDGYERAFRVSTALEKTQMGTEDLSTAVMVVPDFV